MHRWIAAFIAMTALAGAAGAEAPAVAELLDLYRAHGALPLPRLEGDEITEIESGQAIVRVTGTPDPQPGDEVSAMALTAFQLVDAPRLLLWLSVMGGNDERDYRLTPAMLSRGPAGSYVRYQHVDLPWPVRDRHWVIACEKTIDLAETTGDRIWEHSWQLHPDGPRLAYDAHAAGQIPKLDRDDLDDAIYLPSNRGAWTMIEAGEDRTLIVARLDADLGGHFPDALVRAFTKRQLKAGLRTLAEMATQVDRNYDETPVIHTGGGEPISAQEAIRVAMRWREERQVALAD